MKNKVTTVAFEEIINTNFLQYFHSSLLSWDIVLIDMQIMMLQCANSICKIYRFGSYSNALAQLFYTKNIYSFVNCSSAQKFKLVRWINSNNIHSFPILCTPCILRRSLFCIPVKTKYLRNKVGYGKIVKG